MATSARRVTLGIVLLACGACQDVQPGSTPVAPIDQTRMSPGAATDTAEGETDLNVGLEALERVRPPVSLQSRNPFRFGGSTATTPSGVDLAPLAPADERPPTVPTATEGAPRVRLRMIGLVDASAATGRIAVLTDGDVVFHGREGEIVEGRYRILSVGPMSVEIESVHDGRRQVLRLSGS